MVGTRYFFFFVLIYKNLSISKPSLNESCKYWFEGLFYKGNQGAKKKILMFSVEIKTKDLPSNFDDVKSYSKWINSFLAKVGKVKIQYKSDAKYSESTGYASFVYTKSSDKKGSVFDTAVLKIYKDREKKILSKIIYDKPGKNSPFPIDIRVR